MISLIWLVFSVANAFLKFLFPASACGLIETHPNGTASTSQGSAPSAALSSRLLDAVGDVGSAHLDWDVKPNTDVKLDGKIFLLVYHSQFIPTE